MKNPGYKVRLTIGDAVVEIEGKEAGVVKLVTALKDVLRGPRKSNMALLPPALHESIPPLSTASPRSTDIRSFFEQKSPSSDVEAAAVAAHYYQNLAPEGERQEFVDPSLLERAFRLGKRPLPSRIIYTLQNARNAGYLDSLGDGRYKLNPVGYNLVEHALGRSDGEKIPSGVRRKTAKPKRRRRTKGV